MSGPKPVTVYDYRRGLATRVAEEGNLRPDSFSAFLNTRVGDGGAARRRGCAQVALASNPEHSSVDMNGSNEYFVVPRDPRVHTLPLYFTWRCLVIPDVVNATQYIFGEEAASPTPSLTVSINSSGFPVAVFTDSGSTATTLTSGTVAVAGSALGLMVTRAGSTLKLWQNGSAVATSTSVSSTLLGRASTNDITIGRHSGSDYFNGKLDYCDLFSITFPNHDDYRLRWPDPRCEYCLYSYTGELDAQTVMRDRGRYEAHAKGQNTPTESTAIAVQESQVTGIWPRLSPDGKQQFVWMTGERFYVMGP